MSLFRSSRSARTIQTLDQHPFQKRHAMSNAPHTYYGFFWRCEIIYISVSLYIARVGNTPTTTYKKLFSFMNRLARASGPLSGSLDSSWSLGTGRNSRGRSGLLAVILRVGTRTPTRTTRTTERHESGETDLPTPRS